MVVWRLSAGNPIPSSIVAADLLQWPSSQHSGRAGGRGRARVQRPELDDRPWQTRVVRHRLVKNLSVGIATGQLLFMHQRVCRESPVKGDKMP